MGSTKSKAATKTTMTTVEDLKKAQELVDALLKEKNCGPVMVRLAWHDSGTFDVNIKEAWPKAGGAIGSIRFAPEINHGANAGLAGAVALLEPIKEAVPSISYADLFQLASSRAIALAGGPKIDMIYGRVDATSAEHCSPEGNLPDAEAGDNGKYGGAGGTASTEDSTAQGHLRKVFFRMGLNDEEIVALSGAHTLGRAYKNRSGLGAEKTKFTDGVCPLKLASGESTTSYTAGGSAWSKDWLVFDNSYYTEMEKTDTDGELLKLSTDKIIFKDEKMRPFAVKFAESQDAFFESYAKAHKKLSELGSKFEPAGGITI